MIDEGVTHTRKRLCVRPACVSHSSLCMATQLLILTHHEFSHGSWLFASKKEYKVARIITFVDEFESESTHHSIL